MEGKAGPDIKRLVDEGYSGQFITTARRSKTRNKGKKSKKKKSA